MHGAGASTKDRALVLFAYSGWVQYPQSPRLIPELRAKNKARAQQPVQVWPQSHEVGKYFALKRRKQGVLTPQLPSSGQITGICEVSKTSLQDGGWQRGRDSAQLGVGVCEDLCEFEGVLIITSLVRSWQSSGSRSVARSGGGAGFLACWGRRRRTY